MESPPQTDTLRDELWELLAEVLDVDKELIGYETHLINDLGVDSLMALEIMVSVERRFQLKLTEADLRQLTSLRDVHQLVSERLYGNRAVTEAT